MPADEEKSPAAGPRPVVVVTGASSGIGWTIALHLASQGFRVLGTVRKPEDAERLRQESEHLEPLTLDLTSEDSIQGAAREVADRVGEQGLAGLVNNAGVVLAGPLELISVQEFRQACEVNMFGLLSMTQALLPSIRRTRGRIVNIGSISGRVSVPFVGCYAASKFALEAITDALRRELYPWGIGVSIIDPGNVDTPIWEKSISAAKETEGQLAADKHALYSGAFERGYDVAHKASRSTIPPQVVARHVHHALTSSRPKLRYYVGLQAKVGSWLLWLLPDSVFDWVIRRRLGIGRQR